MKENFLATQEFISILAGVVTMLNGFYLFLYKNLFILGIFFTAFLWILAYKRWSLKQNLSLIERYSLLMELLGELSRTNSKSNQTVLEIIKHPSFELMQRNFIDRKFDKLNKKLDKLISIPYHLLWTNTTLIEEEFVVLVRDTKTLYEEFTEIVKREINSTPDCEIIKEKYKDFISKLNQPEFSEIKKTLPENLLLSPLLPPPYIPHEYK